MFFGFCMSHDNFVRKDNMQINHISGFDISRFHSVAIEKFGNDILTSKEISKHKILIINANEHSQEIQNQFLTQIGFVDIDFARSQSEFESLLNINQYSICIVEFLSLNNKAIFITNLIRNSNKSKHAAILASTYLSEKILDRCIESGMNGVVLKPFMFNMYKKALCFYLSKLTYNKIKSIY